MTRLQQKYHQFPLSESAETLTGPIFPTEQREKVRGLKDHVLWTRKIFQLDICAYSDGSSEGHGRSSWGFVLQRGGQTFEKGKGIMHGGEVYDAEIYGAVEALQAAVIARQEGQNIFVLLDNQAAVGALQTGKTTSSLKLTRTFREIARMVNAKVRWVPGHSKIRGNVEADGEARSALRTLPPRETTPKVITLAYSRRLMHQRQQEKLDEWWSKVCPPRYKDLDLQMRRRKPPELSLPRRILHGLLAARSGHGDFAAYHRRFKHEDSILNCICGQETSPTHFIKCRNHATKMRKLRRGLPMNVFINKLLRPKCSEKFMEFARATGCFGSLSTQLSSAGCEDSN